MFAHKIARLSFVVLIVEKKGKPNVSFYFYAKTIKKSGKCEQFMLFPVSFTRDMIYSLIVTFHKIGAFFLWMKPIEMFKCIIYYINNILIYVVVCLIMPH